MDSAAGGLLQADLFQRLQEKLDDDQKAREEIKDIVESIEKHDKIALTALSNSHATARENVTSLVEHVVTTAISPIRSDIQNLAVTASKYPYFKYNQLWTRQMQDAIFAIILCAWLGGLKTWVEPGGLLSIEQVGEYLQGLAYPSPEKQDLLADYSEVPVNLTDKDDFHLTIEEYLHGLISLIDELARLARNSVTQGDYERPLQISKFVKDLHAGFQILNLKNDSLRKRTDSIKYKVREVEDVVYDLSLRNLLPSK